MYFLGVTSSRPAEFLKGVLTGGPLFFGFVVVVTTLVLLTSTIGVDARWPVRVVLSALISVLAATGAIVARYWHCSRWRAYGAMAVAVAFVAVGMALALLLYVVTAGALGATS